MTPGIRSREVGRFDSISGLSLTLGEPMSWQQALFEPSSKDAIEVVRLETIHRGLEDTFINRIRVLRELRSQGFAPETVARFLEEARIKNSTMVARCKNRLHRLQRIGSDVSPDPITAHLAALRRDIDVIVVDAPKMEIVPVTSTPPPKRVDALVASMSQSLQETGKITVEQVQELEKRWETDAVPPVEAPKMKTTPKGFSIVKRKRG